MPLVSAVHRSDHVVVLSLTNPPVNALSSSVEAALAVELRNAVCTPGTRGVVLASGLSGYFSGGFDVSQFASFESSSDSSVPLTDNRIYEGAEEARVPVVAAISGICFGGGLELALCCAARVATPAATFALPEVSLGIIPGIGGTQRLPRVVGFEPALKMILNGKPVDARSALQMGLVDRIVQLDQEALIDAAAEIALDIASGRSKLMAALHRTDKIGSVPECKRIAEKLMRGDVVKLSRNGVLPQYAAAVRAALAGAEKGGPCGLEVEAAEFRKLVTSPISRALVHMFFSTRQTSKLHFVSENDPFASYVGRAPSYVAVIGGGLMGAGIATAMLQAGMKVIIKEINEKFAVDSLERVRKNLGSMHAHRIDALSVTSEYEPLADVDMVVEAALEDVKVKQEIFTTLQKVCRPDCILATNTSTINIDLIGEACPKAHVAGRVLGVHFFSPAHKMPLIEIVRTPSTSVKVIKDVLVYAKRLRKTPVVVGNCAGFAVNRMYFPQGMVANFLVLHLGQNPYKVDAALERFGIPMGPFRLLDLVGLDIGIAVSSVFGMFYADRSYSSPLLQAMVAAGRKGHKTRAGFYKYSPKSPLGEPDPQAVNPIIEEARRVMSSHNGPAGRLSGDLVLKDDEIVHMLLLPCVNEACRILEERVAFSASDLDICSVMGMAFPSYRGGLMHWAQVNFGGAKGVADRLKCFNDMSNGVLPLFKPSFALERAAALNAPLGPSPKPKRVPGNPSDIVIVSALRTAIGRASRGGFKDTLPDDMIHPVVAEILRRTKVQGAEVDDLIFGTVLARGGTGLAQTRVAGILSGLPVTVPAKTVNRLCSSGLQAIADAAAAIQAGYSGIVIAGGFESMSTYSMENTELKPNPLAEANDRALSCYLSMGVTSENVAHKFGVSRERQDRLAVVSHARASAAKLAKRQASEIVPITTRVKVVDRATRKVTGDKTVVVSQDEGVRVGVTMEHLAKLPSVFKKGGSTTPGNASQLSDGAAAVMLMRRSDAIQRGLSPIASLRSFSVVGVDPAIMGIGPVEAIPRAIEKAGLTISDIDLFEINEAFGSQADYSIEKLGLNRDVVNVMGGAIALGHPLGMTGARMTVSIIHELHRRNGRFGVVSMCVGTGMGAAAVYEVNVEDCLSSAKL